VNIYANLLIRNTHNYTMYMYTHLCEMTCIFRHTCTPWWDMDIRRLGRADNVPSFALHLILESLKSCVHTDSLRQTVCALRQGYRQSACMHTLLYDDTVCLCPCVYMQTVHLHAGT